MVKGNLSKFIPVLFGETQSNSTARNTANTNGESETYFYEIGEGKLSKFTHLGETLFNPYTKFLRI
jgi:hypothetical protein